MTESDAWFLDKWFPYLTGNCPFVWQRELFGRFLEGEFPEAVTAPTGMGKTSVMPIWLLALARTGGRGPVPRRLAWIVNRRVVADQATSDAERLRGRLEEEEARELAEILESMSLTTQGGVALGVSTLRGELADNRAWSEDPSRPAVVVGTVDMIGSRLLFSGYGDGRWWRPQHAGMLGQDALLVNDEAHLTPAMASLLRAVVENSAKAQVKPVHAMLLSATQAGGVRGAFPESFEADMEASAVFRARMAARKELRIHSSARPEKQLETLALEGKGRTLVFVRSPKRAQEVAAGIIKTHQSGDRVRVLTGTMRGLERDGLLQDAVMGAFLSAESGQGRHWLVCTSAGEVGINLSSDTLVTELDTLDHLVQRLGRLNRFGEGAGEAHVVCKAAADGGRTLKPREERLERAREFLEGLPEGTWGMDVSLAALGSRELPQEACEPLPAVARLEGWLAEAWAMTAVTAGEWRSRPAVDLWLHGEQEDREFPETHLAWREEVSWLTGTGMGVEEVEEALEQFPVGAHEKLRESSRSMQEKLRAMATSQGGRRVILIRADGGIERASVEELAGEAAEERLRNALLLLPPGVGRLEGGMLAAGDGDAAVPYDVAEARGGRRARFIAEAEDGGWRFRRLGAEGEHRMEGEDFEAACGAVAEAEGLALAAAIDLTAGEDEDAAERLLTYWKEKAPERAGGAAVLLEDHTEAVAATARMLGGKLGLPEEVVAALELAGRWHDRGKSRRIWQEAMGQKEGEAAVAKPGRRKVRPKLLSGYRHELGSLLDAPAEAAEKEEARELGLHLVAAHHGWARPHFRERAADRENLGRSKQAALEAARRYGRLQRKYGCWGLAYLEGVFKAADALVSRQEREQPTNA